MRWKRRKFELEESITAEFGDWISESSLDDLFEEDNTQEIKAVLKELPTNQREVILLKYWEGMSYEEIAVIVGCPIGTIRSRVHYAKLKIKEMLDFR